MRKIQQAEVKGEKIIVRCDFNVPIKNGKVYEDFRIKAAIPTIEFLEKAGAAKIILISHLGRPDGARVRGLSLEPVAKKLKTILGEKTKIVQTKIADFPAYQISPKIILLENIRFWADEVPTPRLQHRGSGSRPAPMPKDRSSPTESDTRRSHRTDRSDAEGSELRPKRRSSVGEF